MPTFLYLWQRGDNFMENEKNMEQNPEGKKKKVGKRNILSNIVLVIAVVVFLYSGYQLYTIFSEYHKGDKEYESVIDEAVTEQPSESDDSQDKNSQNDAQEQAKKTEHKVLKVDFDKLKKVNKDTVAWIRFDEPSKINYPVVQTTDNDRYLQYTFEGKKTAVGAIFVDATNAGDFSDRNTFIYGHNMKNGSMFGHLRKYRDESFYREYPFFYIYTPDGKEVKYQIFAACIVEDTSDTYQRTFADDAAYLKYLEYVQGVSIYKTGVELTAESKIVSLSTCTNVSDTQRFVVHGVKVSEMTVK